MSEPTTAALPARHDNGAAEAARVRWSFANRLERIHANNCRRAGTWNERDCLSCRSTQTATQMAAGAVTMLRMSTARRQAGRTDR